MSDTGIRPATAADRRGIVDDLIEAFMDDPVVSWVFPDLAKRRRHARAFFDMHARLHLGSGVSWRVPGAGAAVWAPPGTWKTSPLDDLRLAAGALRGVGRRGLAVGNALRGVERKHPAEPHAYLADVGVRPERQGRGLGAVLIEPGLAWADERRLPCYLESSNPRNVPFYRRHGFAVTDEHQLAGGPVMTLMWRDAAFS